jgi:hypothetical protein
MKRTKSFWFGQIKALLKKYSDTLFELTMIAPSHKPKDDKIQCG